MTRSILAGLAAAVAISVLTGTGCQSTGVGDPCTPEQEYDPSFLGFRETEVSVESKSFQCQTRVCLVNHFQGRVSCPYGQAKNGNNLAGTTSCTGGSAQAASRSCPTPTATWGCCAPGTNAPITGPLDSSCMYTDMTNESEVPAQCSDRKADSAVYCSCRCANVHGQTNDGANYCTCPDGFSCSQLVGSVNVSNEGLTGAYCVKNGTQYDQTTSSCLACTPGAANCGTAQGVTGK